MAAWVTAPSLTAWKRSASRAVVSLAAAASCAGDCAAAALAIESAIWFARQSAAVIRFPSDLVRDEYPSEAVCAGIHVSAFLSTANWSSRISAMRRQMRALELPRTRARQLLTSRGASFRPSRSRSRTRASRSLCPRASPRGFQCGACFWRVSASARPLRTPSSLPVRPSALLTRGGGVPRAVRHGLGPLGPALPRGGQPRCQRRPRPE